MKTGISSSHNHIFISFLLFCFSPLPFHRDGWKLVSSSFLLFVKGYDYCICYDWGKHVTGLLFLFFSVVRRSSLTKRSPPPLSLSLSTVPTLFYILNSSLDVLLFLFPTFTMLPVSVRVCVRNKVKRRDRKHEKIDKRRNLVDDDVHTLCTLWSHA